MDWASFVVGEKIENNFLYFLVQDSINTNPRYPNQKRQTKFPGGKNRDHPEDKTFLDTACRESLEETHLELERGKEVVIYDVIKGFHRQVFYLVDALFLKGNLRTETKEDGNSIIFPPEWAMARDLEKRLYPSHREAFRRSVRELKKQHKDLVV